jgi:CHU_C Type IX secretion signal domain
LNHTILFQHILKSPMTKVISILSILLFLSNISYAQTPSDLPCTAPTIQVSNTPGTFVNNNISACCSSYTNFLNANPTCGVAQTNRDAWYKISGMTAGEQYNFMYIETGNRQTWVEIFELPAGKDCAVPTNYKTVKCARANNVAFYPGSTVSATFIPPAAGSSYYARFQRLNVSDQALEGTFSITKSYPNEEPCGAILLQKQPAQGTNPTFGNTITAADYKPEVLTGPLCGANNDVWYKFVATACSMSIFVDNLTQTTYEMQAAIMASADGTCNNLMDVTPCGGKPDEYLDILLTPTNLTIGKTYYIIVDGYSPPYINAVGNFSIELFDTPNATPCTNIASICDCGDPLTCGGTVLPNSAAGNAALNAAAANATGNGCFVFTGTNPPPPPLCGGNNTVEFCSRYTALSSDTLIAFDNVVSKDPACEVFVSKNVAYEEGVCATPINPVCLDFNKKSSVFKVEPGKTYRFCRQITTNGGDPDCWGKTYQSYCAFMWKIPVNFSTNQTICNGEKITIGSNTYTTTGVYKTTLTSKLTGCDSILTLNLTVLPASNSTITTSICNGDSYLLGTTKYNTSGTYKKTVKTANGCDSTITLNLTVLPSNIVKLSKTICFEEKVTIGTQDFNKTGVYVVPLKTNTLKCDSTVELTLTVLPKIGTTLKKAVCFGGSATINGQVYNATGKFDQKFKAKNGCDSTYTIDFIVLPSYANIKTKGTGCNGKPYQFGTQVLTQTGTYTETFKTKQYGLACDSTVTIDFTVTGKVEKNIVKSICEGETEKIGTQSFTKTGKYVISIPLGTGCDSIVNLDLTVNPKKTENVTKTLCYGESITIFGIKYDASTVTVITGKTLAECDSTVNLNLTVTSKNEKRDTFAICDGKSVTVKGKPYTYAQEDKFVEKDANGCDITYFVVIIVENIKVNIDVKVATCKEKKDGSLKINSPKGANYKYLWSEKNITTDSIGGLGAGDYTVTITNTKTGCTKVETRTIGVRYDGKAVVTFKSPSCDAVNNGSLTVTSPVSAGTKYVWNPSSAGNGPTVTNIGGGTYSVTATETDGCISTATTTLTPTNFTVTAKPNIINNVILGKDTSFVVQTTAPNPTFTITTPNEVDKKKITFKIDPKNPKEITYLVKVSSTSDVVYTITVTDASGCTASTTVTVKGKFDIPLAFSPEGKTNENKTFQPVVNKPGITYTKFIIFDRWGEVIYDASGKPDPEWNGNYGNNTKLCPSDVYIYLIQPSFATEPFKGSVSLIR